MVMRVFPVPAGLRAAELPAGSAAHAGAGMVNVHFDGDLSQRRLLARLLDEAQWTAVRVLLANALPAGATASSTGSLCLATGARGVMLTASAALRGNDGDVLSDLPPLKVPRMRRALADISALLAAFDADSSAALRDGDLPADLTALPRIGPAPALQPAPAPAPALQPAPAPQPAHALQPAPAPQPFTSDAARAAAAAAATAAMPPPGGTLDTGTGGTGLRLGDDTVGNGSLAAAAAAAAAALRPTLDDTLDRDDNFDLNDDGDDPDAARSAAAAAAARSAAAAAAARLPPPGGNRGDGRDGDLNGGDTVGNGTHLTTPRGMLNWPSCSPTFSTATPSLQRSSASKTVMLQNALARDYPLTPRQLQDGLKFTGFVDDRGLAPAEARRMLRARVASCAAKLFSALVPSPARTTCLRCHESFDVRSNPDSYNDDYCVKCNGTAAALFATPGVDSGTARARCDAWLQRHRRDGQRGQRCQHCRADNVDGDMRVFELIYNARSAEQTKIFTMCEQCQQLVTEASLTTPGAAHFPAVAWAFMASNEYEYMRHRGKRRRDGGGGDHLHQRRRLDRRGDTCQLADKTDTPCVGQMVTHGTNCVCALHYDAMVRHYGKIAIGDGRWIRPTDGQVWCDTAAEFLLSATAKGDDGNGVNCDPAGDEFGFEARFGDELYADVFKPAYVDACKRRKGHKAIPTDNAVPGFFGDMVLENAFMTKRFSGCGSYAATYTQSEDQADAEYSCMIELGHELSASGDGKVNACGNMRYQHFLKKHVTGGKDIDCAKVSAAARELRAHATAVHEELTNRNTLRSFQKLALDSQVDMNDNATLVAAQVKANLRRGICKARYNQRRAQLITKHGGLSVVLAREKTSVNEAANDYATRAEHAAAKVNGMKAKDKAEADQIAKNEADKADNAKKVANANGGRGDFRRNGRGRQGRGRGRGRGRGPDNSGGGGGGGKDNALAKQLRAENKKLRRQIKDNDGGGYKGNNRKDKADLACAHCKKAGGKRTKCATGSHDTSLCRIQKQIDAEKAAEND